MYDFAQNENQPTLGEIQWATSSRDVSHQSESFQKGYKQFYQVTERLLREHPKDREVMLLAALKSAGRLTQIRSERESEEANQEFLEGASLGVADANADVKA